MISSKQLGDRNFTEALIVQRTSTATLCPTHREPLDGGPIRFRCPAGHGVQAADIDHGNRWITILLIGAKTAAYVHVFPTQLAEFGHLLEPVNGHLDGDPSIVCLRPPMVTVTGYIGTYWSFPAVIATEITRIVTPEEQARDAYVRTRERTGGAS